MTRHDEAALWDYAARELDPAERRVVEGHLEDCLECREQLASVQVAREALEAARQAMPFIGWDAVDEAVGRVVEKRLGAQARRPMLRRAVGGAALLAAGMALALMAPNRPATLPQEPLAVEAPPAPAAQSRVARAEGLSLVGTRGALLDGAILTSGDVLETTSSGRAFVELPDQSSVRLGPAAQLGLIRGEEHEITLRLNGGSLAVRASPQQRKDFVVRAGRLTVHAEASAFVVTNSPEAAEVAVVEGRVAVEFASGQTQFVDAGTRLRVDRRGRATTGLKVSGAHKKQLEELTAVSEGNPVGEPPSAMVAASGGRASAPPLLSAQGAPRSLPRLDPAQARARQVELPAEAAAAVDAPPPANQQSAAPAPARAPAVSAPDPMPIIQRLEPTTEVVVEAPGGSAETSEWATLPNPQQESAPAFAEWKPTAKLAETPSPSPARDLETVFLQRAEASLQTGGCDRFVPGLEELAMEQVKTRHSEQSRLLLARCFDAQLRPRQALNQYRTYLEEYPRGRYEREAREAVGDVR